MTWPWPWWMEYLLDAETYGQWPWELFDCWTPKAFWRECMRHLRHARHAVRQRDEAAVKKMQDGKG